MLELIVSTVTRLPRLVFVVGDIVSVVTAEDNGGREGRVDGEERKIKSDNGGDRVRIPESVEAMLVRVKERVIVEFIETERVELGGETWIVDIACLYIR